MPNADPRTINQRLTDVERSLSKRKAFVLIILFGLLIAKIPYFAGWHPASKITFTEFDLFHFISRLFWDGRLVDAYSASRLIAMHKEFTSSQDFMLWHYPPPFNIVLAPLGLLSKPAAYVAFTGASLSAYLLVLGRLAGAHLPLIAMIALPSLTITITSGQSSMLVAALIGLAAAAMLAGRERAGGFSLGLVIIKPHLALATGLFALFSRRWWLLAFASLSALLLMALATLPYGVEIWRAFLASLRENNLFLTAGAFPLFRMVSIYSSCFTLGLSSAASMVVQAGVALTFMYAVWQMQQTAPPRDALGFAITGSLLLSPYALDYDMVLVFMGLALLFPTMAMHASNGERVTIYACFFLASSFGIAGHLAGFKDSEPTPAGIFMLVGVTLLWRIVRRSRASSDAHCQRG